MPAWRLSDSATSVGRFDVLAISLKNDPDLPTHLMLCNESADRDDVTRDTNLKIAHMGPPLHEKSGEDADAVGSVKLTESEKKQVEFFVKERLAESKELRRAAKAGGPEWSIATQYRIAPPATPPSSDCSYCRFSCVGFVLSAYEEAAISLLADACPLLSLDQIKAIYGEHSRLDDPEFRTAVGIGDGDSWPVALAGYVLNAMDHDVEVFRKSTTIPYQPESGDEYFPKRKDPTSGH